MAINFPDSPTVDQQFSFGGTSWIWDGDAWNLYLGGNIVTSSQLSATLSSYAIASEYQRNILYLESEPAFPYSGQIYVNSLDSSLYRYNSSSSIWESIGKSTEPDSDQAIIAMRMFS
jgi:hypothetical protein